ncbi:MAG: hypothetical protein IPG75_11740 [Gemmatimonadetes bacterium]|nr:hypothetical protein [Gemmatimonadota bacterium]
MWLPAGTRVQARVSCHKSRLYHQKAIAERVIRASGCPAAPPAGPDGEPEPGTQLVVVRLLRDEVTVSLDSSGTLLHRRGYRLETAKAPLRETLAAALLLAGEWDPGTPLVDPMCGSGTVAIEAALLARAIAPGAGRAFRFRHWLPWDDGSWAPLLAAARAAERPRAGAELVASDRDAGAIRAARANADRAGVAADIRFVERSVSDLDAHAGPGQLVSNPPYGVRVSEGRELRDLFARLGQRCRERLPGFAVTLLVPETPLERATGLPFRELFRTQNGGLLVRAVHAPGRPEG